MRSGNKIPIERAYIMRLNSIPSVHFSCSPSLRPRLAIEAAKFVQLPAVALQFVLWLSSFRS